LVPLNFAFKALADSNRRQILNMLQNGDLTAGEIADHFSMTKPSISHHLNVLKQANLVQDVRKGQNIYYSLNTTVFQELIGWFYDFIDSYRQKETEKAQAKTKEIKTENTIKKEGDQ
jgi:ArsR family transcriptional regulator, arsenate/arsenite/antimonite-responsive transcriptional repressor